MGLVRSFNSSLIFFFQSLFFQYETVFWRIILRLAIGSRRPGSGLDSAQSSCASRLHDSQRSAHHSMLSASPMSPYIQGVSGSLDPWATRQLAMFRKESRSFAGISLRPLCESKSSQYILVSQGGLGGKYTLTLSQNLTRLSWTQGLSCVSLSLLVGGSRRLDRGKPVKTETRHVASLMAL